MVSLFIPQLAVPLLHDVKSFLFFAAVGDEAFAVPVVLDAG
jgi:hypothetical protein